MNKSASKRTRASWHRWLSFERVAIVALLFSFVNQFAILITLSNEGMGIGLAFRPVTLGYGVRGKYIAIGDIVLAVVFVAWLIHVAIRGRWRELRLRAFPICLLALLCVGMLSALNSEGVWRSLQVNISEIGFGARALLFAEAFREAATEGVQWFLYLIVAPLLFISLLQRIPRDERAWILNLLLMLTLLSEAVAIYDYVVRQDAVAVAGTFGSRNIYTGYLAMILPIMLTFGFHSEHFIQRILAFAAIVIGIFTGLSGWAWIALAIALVITAWRCSRVWAFGCATALGAFIVFSFALSTRFAREAIPQVVHRYDSEGDVRKEYIEWQVALNLMSQDAPPPRSNFPFGAGIGGYQINIDAYYASLPNKEKMPLDSNSLYLVIGGTLGFIGLAVLAFVLIHTGALAVWLERVATDNFDRIIGAGVLGSMVGFGIASIFTNLLVRGTGPIFVFIVCIIHVLYHEHR